MKRYVERALAAGIAALFATSVLAQTTGGETGSDLLDPSEAVAAWQADPSRMFEASEINLTDFRWIARPVVVFGDSPFDPNFRTQIDLLQERPGDLAERDVLIVIDADPDADTDVRLQLRPRAFMLAIIGKDGQVKLRKPLPWDVREISRSIDKMPLRQQEINAERGL